MTPLTTVQGLSAIELKKTINHRKVFIWGSGPTGRSVLISLLKSGISPHGFIDGRSPETSKQTYSLPVYSPEEAINGSDAFVVIANLRVKEYAEKLCRESGRIKSRDYLTHYQIQRPEAAVDITGMCNLKCPSCPRGNMEPLLPEGHMPLSTYTKVLDKLQKDIPNLTNIELYTWGEPLLNPDIASIIQITEKTVPCTVSTNLMATEKLEPAITAKPSQFKVTINGFERQYEANMKGASWDRLLRNLNTLSILKSERNITTAITLQCYAHENNPGATRKMTDLAKQLGFAVEFRAQYVNPYDNYLNFKVNKDISDAALDRIRKSPWSLDQMLARAASEGDKPCLCQRIFPIINWDLSVALCHVYYGPVIARNFLEVSWEDLLSTRHQAAQCVACQGQSLHRLDVDLFTRK